MPTRSVCFVLAALALAGACSSPEAEPPAAVTSASAGKRVDAASAGGIAGRITFAGTPPAAENLKMTSDAFCVDRAGGPIAKSDAVIVGADGSLANAFVWIKDGLDASYTFDLPTAAFELDQRGCRYAPRVAGVRTGQAIDVINSDDTLHNVHAQPGVNRGFNEAQPKRGMRMHKTFTVQDVMVKFSCNVHPWMSAWVGVVAHPFFAVTGADGSFSIAGLPPGTYLVEAWHERFGTRTAQVTVAQSQTQTVALQFSGN
jgi:plastocyanin